MEELTENRDEQMQASRDGRAERVAWRAGGTGGSLWSSYWMPGVASNRPNGFISLELEKSQQFM